jgi:hypothetical protein
LTQPQVRFEATERASSHRGGAMAVEDIIGLCENAVASSRIDRLAGLSGLNTHSTPHGFWA